MEITPGVGAHAVEPCDPRLPVLERLLAIDPETVHVELIDSRYGADNPCTVCGYKNAVGVCEVDWAHAARAVDACLDCVLGYVEDLYRDRPKYIQVGIRRPSPWVVTSR